MIRIGTAGWSYMSGRGKWAGVFYPKGTSDPLDFYARFFETVEINSTFYRPIKAVPHVAADTYVAYNNHFGGKAVANALEMKLLLGQQIPQDIPRSLLDEFPDLAQLIEKESVESRSATE